MDLDAEGGEDTLLPLPLRKAVGVHLVWALGFRVVGLGFGVSGFGFRGLGFRV